MEGSGEEFAGSSARWGRYSSALRRSRENGGSTSTQLAIKCSKFIILLPRRKDNIVRMMKQNHRKHVYLSFFNPLKVTGELEIESLG